MGSCEFKRQGMLAVHAASMSTTKVRCAFAIELGCLRGTHRKRTMSHSACAALARIAGSSASNAAHSRAMGGVAGRPSNRQYQPKHRNPCSLLTRAFREVLQCHASRRRLQHQSAEVHALLCRRRICWKVASHTIVIAHAWNAVCAAVSLAGNQQSHRTAAAALCCVAGRITAPSRFVTVKSPAADTGGRRALRSCCRRMLVTPRQLSDSCSGVESAGHH